jgi:hypothetical protein
VRERETSGAGQRDNLVAGIREQGGRRLPAIQFGVFERLDAEADGTQTGHRLKQGFDAWKAERQGSSRVFPGLLYVALHSFSHLLLTAVALECGYPASSIRERIYAIPSVRYGVLLYTGTSDAERTLGGLIQVGRRIHNWVRSALELGLLCSSDPDCAQHDPESRQDHRHLHGAACHGCVLTAETSCEQQNVGLHLS